MTKTRRRAANAGYILLLMAGLCLAACSQVPAPVTDLGVESTDPEAGGAAGADSGPQTPVPTPTETREPSPRLDGKPLPEADGRQPTAQPPTATPPPTADGRLPTAQPPTPTATALPTAQPPTPTATPGGERVHVVQPGENLYRIGLLYGVSWVAIAEYNGITNPDAITVGQELRIPPGPTPTAEARGSGGAGEERAAPSSPTADERPLTADDERLPTAAGPSPLAPTLAAVGGQPSVVGSQSSVVVVSVSAGDTLYSIAQQHGVSWDQVAEANGLATPNQLYPGQLLKIPPDVPGPTPEFNHRVHTGETLSKLAQQYGLPAGELAAANRLTAPYVIYSGQTLVIPSDE